MYGTICTSTASYKSSATLICLQAMCIVLVNLLNKIKWKVQQQEKRKGNRPWGKMLSTAIQ